VQYVDRVSDASGKGTGRGQTVHHYKDITCLIVVGADALVIAENGSEWIELNVTDGGPHADFVLINRGADVDPESEEDDAPECDEAAGDDTVALARGNVTVYDAPDE
jgi:hypothetical protein